MAKKIHYTYLRYTYFWDLDSNKCFYGDIWRLCALLISCSQIEWIVDIFLLNAYFSRIPNSFSTFFITLGVAAVREKLKILFFINIGFNDIDQFVFKYSFKELIKNA